MSLRRTTAGKESASSSPRFYEKYSRLNTPEEKRQMSKLRRRRKKSKEKMKSKVQKLKSEVISQTNLPKQAEISVSKYKEHIGRDGGGNFTRGERHYKNL